MRAIRTVFALALILVALPACERPEPEAGAEQTGELTTPEAYDADTLPWVEEGRTVEFGGREWLPVGVPINDPAVVHVGEFEGMQLYAPADETVPYDHLMFYVGGAEWQVLQPTAPVPDTTEADTAGPM